MKYLIKLNLARNCLRYLVKLYDIKQLYLPYYICPTVRQALQKENCKLKFYHIDEAFYPILDFDENDFIIYPNYFGICADNILKLVNKYKNLIVDNAQAFYMTPKGLASVYSLRKFFDVSDGAYLCCDDNLSEDFEKDNYIMNSQILTHEDFVKNEIRLNNEEIKFMSDFTQNKMANFDIELLKQDRLKKFDFWHSKFGDKNLLKFNLSEYDIPFVYPYMTDEKSLPTDLTGVEILRYWSSIPCDFTEYKFYKNIIPIPLK